MEAIDTDGGPLASTDQKPHLTIVPPGTSCADAEMLAWFEEVTRLVAEAEERFRSGRLLPTLSSLAAMPPLHRMLIERCSEMFDETTSPEPEPPAQPNGMYL